MTTGHPGSNTDVMSITERPHQLGPLTKAALALLAAGVILTIVGNPIFGESGTAAGVAHYAQLGLLGVGIIMLVIAVAAHLRGRRTRNGVAS